MMFAASSTIIGTILSFPYFMHIVVFIFLLIGASIGYARGFWRGTFRLIFVVILLVVTWFTLLDELANYVNLTLLEQLKISFKFGETEVTSIEGLVLYYAQHADASVPAKYTSEAFLKELSFSLSKSIAWLLSVVVIHFVSWVVSGILYFLIIRLIIPEKVRKIKLRLLGAIMGLAQAVVLLFSYVVSFSSISPAVAMVNKPGEGLFMWLSPNAQLIIKTLDPNDSMLITPYIEQFGEEVIEQRFDFKVEDTAYNFNEEILEWFQVYSNINDQIVNSETETETPGEESTSTEEITSTEE